MRVLLVTPPLTQPNTPYPATPALAGFLRSRGVRADQADLSLDLFLALFSRAGLREVEREIRNRRAPSVRRFLAHAARYAATVGPVIRFLQGRAPALARRIVARTFLPEGPRFAHLDSFALEELGEEDLAKHLASLYVDDLADAIREGIDPRFGLARYAESLAVSAPSFAPLRRALEAKPTLVDRMIDRIARRHVARYRPDLVAITIPFPGNVYGAFRVARAVRGRRVRAAIGGGYVSTELRELSDPRVFDYVDFVILDDGELPLLRLAEGDPARWVRTFVREGHRVVWKNAGDAVDIAHRAKPAPSYRGLPLDRYISMLEMLNPMHRLWSDGRWNKLMLAHGCYWRRCAFCDTSLDYIRRFDPAPARVLADRIEQMVRETGERGFHFTDEAVPPALLTSLAAELIRRGLRIRWWCNIRFERAFTPALCRRLARAGCVAVSGGLETVSDRLLRLMNKGVSVTDGERAAKAFADAGILVHAYLMYGFPTQTARETVEALERVRRLFAAGHIQSAFWHRFALTAHSPIARNPRVYGIRVRRRARGGFAVNELEFEDPGGCDPARFGPGLRTAVYNFMHGVGLERDVRTWFDQG